MSGGGLSSARLERMHQVLAGYVERGDVPGLVALVSRRGEVHVDAIGVPREAIFRVVSITKPITAVATLILMEECRLRLDEPVDGLLPELAARRVLRQLDSPLDDRCLATSPPAAGGSASRSSLGVRTCPTQEPLAGTVDWAPSGEPIRARTCSASC